MKRSILLFAFLTSVSLMLWQSCSMPEEDGFVRFELNPEEDSKLKSVSSQDDLFAALVSVAGKDGQLIFDKEELILYNFGNQIITRSLKLPVGKYELVEFMLIDSIGNVLWATPMDNSPLSHLVTEPLPKSFKVRPDETTKLGVEVIRVGDYSPSDFGYASFIVRFIKHFCLKVYCPTGCLETWYDSIRYSNDTFAPYYEPRLIFKAGGREILNSSLQTGLNYYELPYYWDTISITATDFMQNTIFSATYSLEQLLRHGCRNEYQPLRLTCGPDSSIIITPEGMVEPDINQGACGFIYTPITDIMSMTEFGYMPVVKDLYIYPYIPVDSLYFNTAPINCCFPEPYLVPTAIVRSNSDGFYQVPLSMGEYLYMVRMPEGYFIDLYISSHLPGKITVYPGEVTKTNIFLIDCSLIL